MQFQGTQKAAPLNCGVVRLRKDIMSEDYEIRDDEHEIGKVLIVRSPWKDKFKTMLKAMGIHALRLSKSMGFTDTDVSFIEELDCLRSLEIYSWNVKDVTAIGKMNNLEVIGLQTPSRKRVDLSHLNKLRVALLTYHPGLVDIFKVSTLEYLNIGPYPYENLEELSDLVNLKSLLLTSRKLTSLTGIEHLKQLESLDLYNCPNLQSLNGVEKCLLLSDIEVEACRHISAKRMKTHNK